MIIELCIKNFAIIEDLTIQFTKGLNLITGETGSGKSIIIEALSVILGGRATKDFIRKNQKKSFLQAVFLIEYMDKIEPILDKYGIEVEKDELLIISREISLDYPSISRINGVTVTLSILNKLTSNLVDIFGQHEHQSLFNVSGHKILIDSFGDEDFKKMKCEIKTKYLEYMDEKMALSKMNIDPNEREREIDLLKYQVKEIQNSNLDNENEEELQNNFIKISNIKNIKNVLEEIVQNLNNSDQGQTSITDILRKNTFALGNILKYDNDLKKYFDRLENVSFELEDIDNELQFYLSNIDTNEEEFYYLNEKIDLINKLKRKYGNTIEEILEYEKIISKRLEKFLNHEQEVENYKMKIRDYEKKLKDLSSLLSSQRKLIAKELERKISYELKDLNMNNVTFKVGFSEKQVLSDDGFDTIEFLISTNIGEDLKPLTKIVSGGEMSRIMLGFKNILASYDNIPTLIFDEIDTGISGRTAQIVGEKIYNISKKRQVISISHLPQIAALADSHYIIFKKVIENTINSDIKKLSDEERVVELGRLLGGVDVTDTTLQHAREMLEMTKKIKK